MGILVFGFFLGCFQVAWADQTRTITLKEALDLAFGQNTSYSLFSWEQAIAERRERLQKFPQVTTRIEPFSVQAGVFADPEGSVTVTMPLGETIDLTGSISVKLDPQAIELKPTGSLTFSYDLFSPPTTKQTVLSAEEEMKNQANALVLQVVDLFIQLRQAIDLKDYEEAYLEYLKTSLEAARLTPNYDELPLRRELRDQMAKLSSMQEELDQLQLRLAILLGTTESGTYNPVLDPRHLELGLVEEELLHELFSTNHTVRNARAELVFVQDQLEAEKKTRGWDLEATGSLSTDLPWQIGVTASKVLYPSAIILEELELAVAKAEHALEAQENAVREEFLRALQAIASQKSNIELRKEHLAEAQDDWGLRQRQYEAGLVTELQMEEAALILRKAELNYFHAQLGYARSVLDLWSLCGRDLTLLVFEILG